MAELDGRTLIQNGWYWEKNAQWPGQATSLEVKEVVHHEKTDFQDLLVFDSATWGRVLVLDGVIQLTERDECSYQEMMAHLPMHSHTCPRDVLVIGGGDGGVLREICKHSCLEKVTICEIDGGVVAAAKKFFPKIAASYDHPKVTVNIGDGLAFATAAADCSYDVMVVDSSDPVGPAEKLFSPEFYQNIHRILRPGGVICSQGECLWINKDLIKEMISIHGKPFHSAEYASIQVPTYPSGQIGAFIARKADQARPELDKSCRKPLRCPGDMSLSYYSEDMHSAAFALPRFLLENLKKRKSPP
jgi:spermidine synthase